ncbi:MAG TPA: DUF6510 family protein [Candidatus Acidoferrales bacterium]|nr:DUF6510 family protein [Candidatus Acidoferrales bacterium]
MDGAHLKLDGNAMAGVMQELFVGDITAARGACAACGSIAVMGEQHAFMYPLSPGAVLRCAGCESVLMVVVRTRTRVRIGFRDLAWIEVSQPPTT